MGWLYLAVVIELTKRKVLGWYVPDSMRTPLIITSLDVTLGNGAVVGVCSILTGQPLALERFCATRGISQSKGRVATCYDNPVIESFFAIFKVEFYYQHTHLCDLVTKAEIAEWITFYNTSRFDSALGYNRTQEDGTTETNARAQAPKTTIRRKTTKTVQKADSTAV